MSYPEKLRKLTSEATDRGGQAFIGAPPEDLPMLAKMAADQNASITCLPQNTDCSKYTVIIEQCPG